MEVHIVCTLHDLDGKIVKNLVTNQWGKWLLKSKHGAMSVDFVATAETFDKHRELLSKLDSGKGRVAVWREEKGRYASNGLRNSHLQALAKGVERSGDNGWVFYVDGDRLVADNAFNRFRWIRLLHELSDAVDAQSSLEAISIIRNFRFSESMSRKMTEIPVLADFWSKTGVRTDPFSSYLLMKAPLAKKLLVEGRKEYEKEVAFPVLEWTLRTLKEGRNIAGFDPSPEAEVGYFEDYFPERSDWGGFLALDANDLTVDRMGLESDAGQLEKRIEIARRSIRDIEEVLGDGGFEIAKDELLLVEKEGTSHILVLGEGRYQHDVDDFNPKFFKPRLSLQGEKVVVLERGG